MTAALKPDQSLAVEGWVPKNIDQTPGDKVYQKTAHLPDRERSAIRWFHSYVVSEELSFKAAAAKIGYSDTVVSFLFSGRYQALEGPVKAIEQLKQLHEARTLGKVAPFIKTTLYCDIERYFDACREFNRMGMILGESQIGKSICARQYERTHNHGSTKYVRVPSTGGIGQFISELAQTVGVKKDLPANQLRARIFKAFDDRMLLIVDEAHLAVGSGKSFKVFDFLRELHDFARCGIVILATNAFRTKLTEDALSERILTQLVRRQMPCMQLPDQPTNEDLNAFTTWFGLPPASGSSLKLQERVIKEDALGVWLMVLRMGSKIAAKRKEPLSWDHIHDADAGCRALSKVSQATKSDE